MATEYENLVLTVNFIDNATPGVEKLNAQLKQFGTYSTQSHSTFQGNLRQTQGLVRVAAGDFSRLNTTVTGFTKTIGSATPAIASLGAGVLGAAGIIAAAIVPIKKYAEGIKEIGDLARETGHSGAVIKVMTEEFRRLFGPQGAGLAEQSLRGLSKAMADILNPASELRNHLAQGARFSAEAQQAMDILLDKLSQAALKSDTIEFFNLFTEALKLIEQAGTKARGSQWGAQLRDDVAALASIPSKIAAAAPQIKKPTEDQIKAMETLIKQSSNLTQSFNNMSVSIGRLANALSAVPLAEGSWLVVGAKAFAGALEKAADAIERIVRTKFFGSGEGASIGEQAAFNALNLVPLPGLFNPIAAGKSLVDMWSQVPNPLAGVAQPQRFTGASGEESGSQLNDLIFEENETMSTLTISINRLSDLLMVFDAKLNAQGPEFHNQPLGGVAGESNPIRLPPGINQPGGGAPAESRNIPPGILLKSGGSVESKNFFSKFAEYFPGALKPKGRERAYKSFLSSASMLGVSPSQLLEMVTPLTKQPGSGESYLTGVSEGTGMVSWYGNPPKGSTRYEWPTDPMDPYGKAALGRGQFFPEEKQGISLSSKSTLGLFHLLTDPLGQQYKSQQTDVGPGISTGKILDISPPALETMGYTPQSFKTGSIWNVAPTIVTEQEQKMIFSAIQQMPATIPHMPRFMETMRVGQEALENDVPLTASRTGGIGSDLAENRKLLDRDLGRQLGIHKVNGSGTVDISVTANKTAEGAAVLFMPPAMDRQAQMTETSLGPSEDISRGF